NLFLRLGHARWRKCLLAGRTPHEPGRGDEIQGDRGSAGWTSCKVHGRAFISSPSRVAWPRPLISCRETFRSPARNTLGLFPASHHVCHRRRVRQPYSSYLDGASSALRVQRLRPESLSLVPLAQRLSS